MATSLERRVRVATTRDVPPGTARPVTVDGRTVALVNYGGWFYAVGGDCPHAGGPLAEGRVGDGCLLECPWHRAVFDVRTGRVRTGPARKPLRTYRIVVEGDHIFVALP